MSGFNYDNVVFQFFGRVIDIVILNLLFLVCCIPVVTIGPAIIALYYTTMKIVTKRGTYVTADFWKSFKMNLKQGTGIWLIMAGIGALLYGYMVLWLNTENSLRMVMIVIGGVLVLLYLYVWVWIFPFVAKFDNPLKQQFRSAFIVSVQNFQWTVLSVLIDAGLVAGIYFSMCSAVIFGFVSLLLIVIGFAAIALLKSKYIVTVLHKYLPEETKKQEQQIDDEMQKAEREEKQRRAMQ